MKMQAKLLSILLSILLLSIVSCGNDDMPTEVKSPIGFSVEKFTFKKLNTLNVEPDTNVWKLKMILDLALDDKASTDSFDLKDSSIYISPSGLEQDLIFNFEDHNYDSTGVVTPRVKLEVQYSTGIHSANRSPLGFQLRLEDIYKQDEATTYSYSRADTTGNTYEIIMEGTFSY